MALENLRMMSAILGTALVVQRGTDIDLRDAEPLDLGTVLALAYITRAVVSS